MMRLIIKHFFIVGASENYLPLAKDAIEWPVLDAIISNLFQLSFPSTPLLHLFTEPKQYFILRYVFDRQSLAHLEVCLK